LRLIFRPTDYIYPYRSCPVSLHPYTHLLAEGNVILTIFPYLAPAHCNPVSKDFECVKPSRKRKMLFYVLMVLLFCYLCNMTRRFYKICQCLLILVISEPLPFYYKLKKTPFQGILCRRKLFICGRVADTDDF
jgi:hypothetical protein